MKKSIRTRLAGGALTGLAVLGAGSAMAQEFNDNAPAFSPKASATSGMFNSSAGPIRIVDYTDKCHWAAPRVYQKYPDRSIPEQNIHLEPGPVTGRPGDTPATDCYGKFGGPGDQYQGGMPPAECHYDPPISDSRWAARPIVPGPATQPGQDPAPAIACRLHFPGR